MHTARARAIDRFRYIPVRLSGAPAEAGLQGSGVPLASHGAAAMSRPETNFAEAEAEISEASSEEEGAEESEELARHPSSLVWALLGGPAFEPSSDPSPGAPSPS